MYYYYYTFIYTNIYIFFELGVCSFKTDIFCAVLCILGSDGLAEKL